MDVPEAADTTLTFPVGHVLLVHGAISVTGRPPGACALGFKKPCPCLHPHGSQLRWRATSIFSWALVSPAGRTARRPFLTGQAHFQPPCSTRRPSIPGPSLAPKPGSTTPTRASSSGRALRAPGPPAACRSTRSTPLSGTCAPRLGCRRPAGPASPCACAVRGVPSPG